jgi:hypothetical protein
MGVNLFVNLDLGSLPNVFDKMTFRDHGREGLEQDVEFTVVYFGQGSQLIGVSTGVGECSEIIYHTPALHDLLFQIKSIHGSWHLGRIGVFVFFHFATSCEVCLIDSTPRSATRANPEKPMVLTITPNTKPIISLVTFSPYRGMR